MARNWESWLYEVEGKPVLAIQLHFLPIGAIAHYRLWSGGTLVEERREWFWTRSGAYDAARTDWKHIKEVYEGEGGDA